MNASRHPARPAASDLVFILQSTASEPSAVPAPDRTKPTVEESRDDVSIPGNRDASELNWPARPKLSGNGDLTGALNKRRELDYWLTASDWEPNL